jgi:hypothetical protein
MIYDWNKYGRPRLALFSRVAAWFLTTLVVLSLPFFIFDALRDWTVIFAWLLIVTGAVACRVMLRKIYRGVPDYPAIAAMEREIYGEALEHDGAPLTVQVRRSHCARGHGDQQWARGKGWLCPECEEGRRLALGGQLGGACACGSHLGVPCYCEDDDDRIVYTPPSLRDDDGYSDFLVRQCDRDDYRPANLRWERRS